MISLENKELRKSDYKLIEFHSCAIFIFVCIFAILWKIWNLKFVKLFHVSFGWNPACSYLHAYSVPSSVPTSPYVSAALFWWCQQQPASSMVLHLMLLLQYHDSWQHILYRIGTDCPVILFTFFMSDIAEYSIKFSGLGKADCFCDSEFQTRLEL